MASQQKITSKKPGEDALARALRLSQDYFRRSQLPEGYWCGQLESNTTMEAEYLMLSHFLGRVDPERWRKLAIYILSKQREDGSWGQYFDSPGDLSTSVESYFALKLVGHSADSEPLRKARQFILSRGGVPRVRVFTKIWLALFGQWDWQGTPNMPPELIFLPSWVPFNLYRFASWARATVAPMLIILTRHPICPVPASANVDELYPGGRSQADYCLPKPDGGWGWGRFLYYVDRIVGLYKRLPLHPFRRRAESKVVQWILDHQEADGCWGGIQPPWVYSLIALHHLGGPVNDAAVEKGFAGFEGFVIEDDDTCTVQACMSPVWDTCLAQLALLDSGVAVDDPMVQQSTTWLLDQQILADGDWQVQVKDTQPGGWAFEFHNNQYPDIDDSAEVVMALAGARLQSDDETRRQPAIDRGVAWLEALQSSNGGWGSFDKNNNAYYLTKLPFSDFGETLDPPSVDVTAHILEMYGKLGYTKDHQAVSRAYEFVRREQEEDGSWFGRWGVNYVYGAGAVLPALAALGEDMDQPYVRRAVDWLVSHQNPDGGWGESCGSYVAPELHGVGPSTASQTAWSLLALMAANEGDSPAVRKGVAYLIGHQKDDGGWDEPYFTGTGFPGYGIGERLQQLPKPGEKGYRASDLPVAFMINYRLYRYYWPLMALGRYARISNRADKKLVHQANGSAPLPPGGLALQHGMGKNGKAPSLPLTLDNRT